MSELLLITTPRLTIAGSKGEWRVSAEYNGLLWESGLWSSKKEIESLRKELKASQWFIDTKNNRLGYK